MITVLIMLALLSCGIGGALLFFATDRHVGYLIIACFAAFFIWFGGYVFGWITGEQFFQWLYMMMIEP